MLYRVFHPLLLDTRMDNTIITFIVISLLPILGFYLGWKFHQHLVMTALVQMAKESEINLIYEKINNDHFLYKEDNTFLCQASTLEELAQKLNNQNNNEVIAKVVDRSNSKIFYIIDGEIHNTV